MSIRSDNLQFSIDDYPILKGITLSFNEKKMIGIIGSNGCGKSTLLKCIYRIYEPTFGAIYLDNKPLKTYPLKESAKKMAVLSQHNQFNFDFTCEEMVLMGRNPHKKTLDDDTKEDYDLVKEAMEKVGLSDYLYRFYSTLSGGEQQRVMLARALVQQSPIYLLDEPTNHLDIKYQLELLKIIKDLNCLVVSAFHDLNLAAHVCDELIALKDGKVITQGTPETVLTSELIKQCFDVDAIVTKDSFNRLLVQYTPL